MHIDNLIQTGTGLLTFYDYSRSLRIINCIILGGKHRHHLIKWSKVGAVRLNVKSEGEPGGDGGGLKL